MTCRRLHRFATGGGHAAAGVVAAALACGRTPVVPWGAGEDDPASNDEGGAVEGGWLVTVDTNGYRLLRVETADGSSEVVCELERDGARYTSALFDDLGRLLVTYKVEDSDTSPDQLALLDPCSCEKTVLAEYGYGGAAGLAWGEGVLYAVSHSADALLELDPSTGAATVVGSAGVDIRNHGASWSADEGAVLLLDGAQDRLFRLDVRTGHADVIVDAQFDFSTVGFEVHPRSGRMFACTGDAVLYEIDPGSGAVSAIGPLGHDGNCGNLAAPRGRVACIDD